MMLACFFLLYFMRQGDGENSPHPLAGPRCLWLPGTPVRRETAGEMACSPLWH